MIHDRGARRSTPGLGAIEGMEGYVYIHIHGSPPDFHGGVRECLSTDADLGGPWMLFLNLGGGGQGFTQGSGLEKASEGVHGRGEGSGIEKRVRNSKN